MGESEGTEELYSLSVLPLQAARLKHKATILIISLGQSLLIFSQVKPADTDSSIFSKWRNILRAKKELTFIGAGPWSVNGKGEVPLLFEDQIQEEFLLYTGRSNQVPLRRSLILNFDLGLNMRMYQGGRNPSYHIRPMSIMPGLSFFYLLNQLKFPFIDLEALNKTSLINFYTLKIYFSHFSNGQGGNFYTTDSLNSNRVDGNFSTNFLKTEISWSRFFKDHLLSSCLSYQQDFGIGNLLGFADGLEKSYGKSRIGISILFHSKNIRRGSYKYQEIHYRNIDSAGDNKKILIIHDKEKYRNYFNFKLIYDIEYITGNMSNYITFKNPVYPKNRLGQKFSLSVYSSHSNTISILFLFYYGRDYYNICFPDKILSFKVGLVFDLNKYIPPNTSYLPSR